MPKAIGTGNSKIFKNNNYIYYSITAPFWEKQCFSLFYCAFNQELLSISF